jgi:hypothetical protein
VTQDEPLKEGDYIDFEEKKTNSSGTDEIPKVLVENSTRAQSYDGWAF